MLCKQFIVISTLYRYLSVGVNEGLTVGVNEGLTDGVNEGLSDGIKVGAYNQI